MTTERPSAYLFDPQTRTVLLAAKREAQRLGHGCLGTAHLLSGLAGEWSIGLSKIVAELGITTEQINQEVARELASDPSMESSGTGVQLTPRARHAIDLAKQAAHESGYQLIAAEHLLIGLIREGQDAGFQALQRLIPDLGRLEQAIAKHQAASSPTPDQQLVIGSLENIRHELRVLTKNQLGLFREIRTLQQALEEQMHTLKQLISARRVDRAE
ncbi:MAG: hypothetical protein HYZ92_01980 [Candidatus Omnitrophica bacterium]|nr:hypothetical protein [Candidatus Omnitrophota bacterium]